MPKTFKELQARYVEIAHKATILQYLSNYLASEFMGEKPKRYLLNPEGQALPQSAFEEMHFSILKDLEKADSEMKLILETGLINQDGGRVIDDE